jgi:lysophospholipase L1-like esterase
MLDRTLIDSAAELGRRRADQVIATRTRALRRRAQVLAACAPDQMPPAPAARTSDASEAARPGSASASAGLILAEGDSWFDYPMHDVLQILEDEHGYDIETLARSGDSLEAMAYGDGQLQTRSRRLERLLREQRPLKAILLSGGGNDIAGPQFGMLLNHADSGLAGLNDAVVTGVVEQRMAQSLLTVLHQVTALCRHWTGQALPIVLHGYDYPVPDGRGLLGGYGPLPGPWLDPGFRAKGFGPIEVRKGIVRKLIDRINQLQASVAALPGLEHVQHLDLRGTLSGSDDYRQYWANELHPSPKGFALVAARFADQLRAL